MNRPFFIAGPCSAESPAQLRQVAQSLKRLGVDFLRAGVWKPRSQPNRFEGQGTNALEWLSAVQQEFQLPVATEVASASHVEAVLKAGLKGVWIGARTTVNPFAVQEIAAALSGTALQVFVKNPINPDIALWIGAFERLQKAGITSPVAIHRGFSVYKSGGYRNAPIWMIPMELKRDLPHIPLLCDPSHISGNSLLVNSLAQQAMDLNFDGLMIEVHPNPIEAMSDAHQQLTLAQFEQLIQQLVLRTPNAPNNDLNSKLEEFRTQIDDCDDQIVSLLVQRMQIVNEIGLLKREGSISIYQQERWQEMITRIRQQGDISGLSSLFLEQLFALIHQEAVLRQQEIMQPQVTQPETFFPHTEGDAEASSLMHDVCTKPQLGSIDNVVELLKGERAIILIDRNVSEIYAKRLPPFPTVIMDAQERFKNIDTVMRVVEELMKLKADKTTWLIGIGGGIVCDITGFVASIYMRGVPFALVPTTLLAQADASMGGKNGVNVGGAKNMAGCITQPQWILCDSNLLKTLPLEEIRCGLAEIIKHALIGVPSLLDYIEEHASSLLALEPESVQFLLSVSHQFKCRVVNKDETERGLRRTLNFGHTVGHAIEAVCQHKTDHHFKHGEAVAVGMLFAVALSMQYTQLDASLLPRMKNLYTQLSLPTTLPFSIDDLCQAIFLDKKRAGKSICFILLKEIGTPCQVEIPIDELPRALHRSTERMETNI